MQEENTKELKNPYQVLYLCPRMGAQKFAKMATKYHQEKELQVLEKIAELTDRRLVQSCNLNWRQRVKFSAWRFQVGHRKFYLIPNNLILSSLIFGVSQ